LQGHFVARDLFDPATVVDVTDRVMEQSESHNWEETAQYVKVSGNGIETTSGDANFSAEGLELESSFLPNEAYSQALGDSYYRFYSVARAFLDCTMIDEDGMIYVQMDRVIIDGRRYWVEESDAQLVDDEA